MNINKLVRNSTTENQNSQVFFINVIAAVERQLKQWCPDYEVSLTKLTEYELRVKNGRRYYYFHITEEYVETLQNIGPYALDRVIWNSLESQGLPLQDDHYLAQVLSS